MSVLPPHPRRLLAGALGVAPDSIADDASMNDVPNWDSFSHLTFMLELEKHFDVPLHDQSIAACKSLSGACNYLSSAGKKWQGQ